MSVRTATLSFSMILFNLVSLDSQAEEVVVRAPDGDCFVVDVGADDTFFSVIDRIESNLNASIQYEYENSAADAHEGQREYLIDYRAAPAKKLMAKASNPRIYNTPVTDSEKRDIKFIVTTLGNASLPSIATKKSSLKKAGDRIDRIHPFRFLACIFTDEEMKAGMANMQGRSWVWGEYLDGLSSSLSQEAKLNNLQPFLQDFATILGINVSAISDLIQNQKWSDLVDTLIKIIPRQGNTDRYDM